jgi:hypothetical protein
MNKAFYKLGASFAVFASSIKRGLKGGGDVGRVRYTEHDRPFQARLPPYDETPSIMLTAFAYRV